MKKFVVVMVSCLVLFVFIILNYLLWDKGNMLQQRDSDRIEQDWLRGQNRTLQTTVEELEQTVKSLKSQNSEQADKITNLEDRIARAVQQENINLQELHSLDQALDVYKPFMRDEVKDVFIRWCSDIGSRKFEESLARLGKGFKLWEKQYESQQYMEFISAIQAISVREGKNGDEETFVILEDHNDPYEIKTRIEAEISVKEPILENFHGPADGINPLEVIFHYDMDSGKWVIMSVSAVSNSGKP